MIQTIFSIRLEGLNRFYQTGPMDFYATSIRHKYHKIWMNKEPNLTILHPRF